MVTRINLLGLTRPELNQLLGLAVTSVLLISSFFMNRGETAMAHGDRKGFLTNTVITFVLGLAFLLGVILVEWRLAISEGMTPDSGAPGAVFFMMTGMHAFHVFTGLILLLVVLLQCPARAVFRRKALGGGSGRSVLALCGRGLDLLLSCAVSDRKSDSLASAWGVWYSRKRKTIGAARGRPVMLEAERNGSQIDLGRGGVLGIVVVATVLTALLARPPEFYATVYEPKAAQEFSLPRADGSTFDLADQRGKTVLLFFGYTNCPDVCPTTMANLKQAVSQLGPQAKDVQVVFITVDPDRDTPQGVQAYATTFDPSFIGLSGPTAALETVWNQYGVYRELGPKDAAGNYEVSHTARVTVIDRQGNLRLSINTDATWQDILHDLKLLMDEG